MPLYPAPSSSGQSLYDVVVAPSGGDYTDVDTAVATEGAGTSIFVAPGTYTLTSNIDIDVANITITGAGEATIFEAAANSVHVFDIAAADFHLSNVKITGGVGTYTSVRGIYGLNAARVRIENVHVASCHSQNLLLSNCDGSQVINSRFSDARFENIHVVSDQCLIANNYIYDGYDSTLDCGILYTGNDTTITGNVIDGTTGTAPFYGVEVASTSSGVAIVGNTVLSPREAGIYVQGDTTESVTVQGNTVRDSDKNGIRLRATAEHTSVIGNTIVDASQAANNTHSDILLTNDFSNAPLYTVIVGNSLFATASNKSKYGVEEATNTNYTTVANNIMTGQVTGTVSLVGANSTNVDSTLAGKLDNTTDTLLGNLTVEDDATATKGYRFRTTGSSLDLDAAAADLIVSNYSTVGFAGTQHTYLRFGAASAFATAANGWEWKEGGSVFGTTALTIDPDADSVLTTNSFRLDQTPTSETISPTHTITISVDGTDYKIPIVAA